MQQDTQKKLFKLCVKKVLETMCTDEKREEYTYRPFSSPQEITQIIMDKYKETYALLMELEQTKE